MGEPEVADREVDPVDLDALFEEVIEETSDYEVMLLQSDYY